MPKPDFDSKESDVIGTGSDIVDMLGDQNNLDQINKDINSDEDLNLSSLANREAPPHQKDRKGDEIQEVQKRNRYQRP